MSTLNAASLKASYLATLQTIDTLSDDINSCAASLVLGPGSQTKDNFPALLRMEKLTAEVSRLILVARVYSNLLDSMNEPTPRTVKTTLVSTRSIIDGK